MNGVTCCGIGDAAKYLDTNARGIQNLIDKGKIRFETSGRLNSSRIYIHVHDLVEAKHGKA